MNRKEKFLLYTLIGISGLFTVLFLYKRSYCNLSYPVDSEVIGQYGDFIGGAIGTFVTLLLLWVTFKLQRKTFEKQEGVSGKNIEMLAIQQLNDKFFKLYDVYKDTLDSLSVNVGEEKLRGKMALSHMYNELRERFDVPHVFGVRRKEAALGYIDFYASNKNFMPIFFRIIYHMFEEINQSNDVPLENRMKYVRLLRSQFTETEVLLMRYNAMTSMGVNSIRYINQYNLMKHLPPMEQLEYKEWRVHHQMNNLQVNGINSLLLALKSNMIHVLSGEDQEEIVSLNRRYEFTVNASQGLDRMDVVMKRDKTKRLYPSDIQYDGLEGFPINELKEFLLYYLKDCVVINNFNRFNIRRDLNFYAQDNVQGETDIISLTVINIAQRRIVMNYKQYIEAQEMLEQDIN